MDEWIAYRRLHPDLSEQLRQMIEIMKLGITMLCAAQGMEAEPDQLDFASDDEKKGRPKMQDDKQTPDQAAAILAQHARVARGNA